MDRSNVNTLSFPYVNKVRSLFAWHGSQFSLIKTMCIYFEFIFISVFAICGRVFNCCSSTALIFSIVLLMGNSSRGVAADYIIDIETAKYEVPWGSRMIEMDMYSNVYFLKSFQLFTSHDYNPPFNVLHLEISVSDDDIGRITFDSSPWPIDKDTSFSVAISRNGLPYLNIQSKAQLVQPAPETWYPWGTVIYFGGTIAAPPGCDCPNNDGLSGKNHRPRIPGLKANGHSSVNNQTLTFTHTAFDYRLTGNAGCTTCGGSTAGATSASTLTLERLIAPGANASGSFGWGGFLTTDLRLAASGSSVVLTDPARDGYVSEFPIDASGQPAIGATHDAKSIRAIDANGMPVPLSQATQIVIVGWDDQILTFELSPAVSGIQHGRLISNADSRGQATTLTYLTTAADLAGDSTGFGSWWRLSSIQAPAGDTALITTSATPIGDCYPITGIALPNGHTLSYAYGVWATPNSVALNGLTNVTLSDGSHATIGGTTTAEGNLALSIVDPAEGDPAHEAKTVVLHGPNWADPWTGQPLPWSVSSISNGAGELTYANRRLAPNGERWSITNNHGVISRLVLNNQFVILRSDIATAAVDWNSDPATWPWLTIQSVTISDQNRINQTTDALGRHESWTNDASTGLVTGATDAANHQAQFELDADGRVTTETDRINRVTKHAYDAQGNLLSTTRGFGTANATTDHATYNTLGLPLTRTDGLGHVTEYFYTATGLLLSVKEPADVANGLRSQTFYAYDAVGRIESVTDQAGRQTHYAYDARNRLVKTTYADLSYEEVTYGTGSASGRMLSKRNRNGVMAFYGYDAAGRQSSVTTQVTHADGSVEMVIDTSVYLPGTDLVASSTQHGETTVYTYDARNRRIATTVFATKSKALTTTSTYDEADRLTQETDAFGRRTFYVYDTLDRQIRTVRESVPGIILAGLDPASMTRDTTLNPLWVIEEMSYDDEGQLLSRTDGNGVATTYTYDSVGRLSGQTEAAGTSVAATTSFFYDAAGNQTRIEHPRHLTEPGGFVSTRGYTGRNLLASSIESFGRPEQATTLYTYTLDRKPEMVTDPNGHHTISHYGTCCARLTDQEDAGNFLTHFGYDFVGNTTSVTDPNQLGIVTVYDEINRPVSRTNSANEKTTYVYDDDLTDGAGLDAQFASQIADLNFGYDPVTGYGANGAAVLVTDPLGNKTLTITDGLGRTVRTVDGLGHATTVTYDTVVTDTRTNPDQSTYQVSLVATSVTDPLSHTASRWSDGLGRVQVQVDATGHQARFGFDANGNQRRSRDANNVGQDCLFDARNRLQMCTETTQATTRTTSMGYDAAGNLVAKMDGLEHSETMTYDGNNRKLSQDDRIHAKTWFAYDLVGNLTSITDAEGGVTAYTYDARNLLTKEVFPGPTGGTRSYTYDPGRRLQTRTEATTPVNGGN